MPLVDDTEPQTCLFSLRSPAIFPCPSSLLDALTAAAAAAATPWRWVGCCCVLEDLTPGNILVKVRHDALSHHTSWSRCVTMPLLHSVHHTLLCLSHHTLSCLSHQSLITLHLSLVITHHLAVVITHHLALVITHYLALVITHHLALAITCHHWSLHRIAAATVLTVPHLTPPYTPSLACRKNRSHCHLEPLRNCSHSP